MEESEKKKSKLEMAGEDLFNFAIDRQDVMNLMTRLPEPAKDRRAAIEHELQLLKIISVGWSLSYYLPNSSQKDELTAFYWQLIHEFSKSLSQTTELLLHQDMDYFEMVKNRLDAYIQQMQERPDAPEPAVVIGPEFARVCGTPEDVHTVMVGSKIFIATVGEVKTYLERIKLR